VKRLTFADEHGDILVVVREVFRLKRGAIPKCL
jgi:hypothetical protein